MRSFTCLPVALLLGASSSVLAQTNPSPGSTSESASPASGRRTIDIESPDFRPYPVAIPDARPIGGKRAEEAARILTRALRFDFDLAAQFEVPSPKSYLANPEKEGMTAATIHFDDWLSVGAEGLLKAVVRDHEGKLSVELRFFEVARGQAFFSQRYPMSRPSDAREVGHRFSNALVEALTGAKGIFRTLIAMVKKSTRGRELYVMELDGSNLRPVTKNGSINLLPTWTPDGTGLIFTSYIRHNPNLYRIRLDGQGLTLLSGERGLNTGGAVRPDGARVALTLSRDGDSEIYTMNPDRTGLRRLTNHWAIDSSPSWSPDGRRIAFVSSRAGNPQIFVMNADGSDVTRMTFRGNYNTTPDWSPRGDLIAFTARDERNVFDIFTVDVKTKEIRRLTQDQGNNEEPSFAPDGLHIVFTSTREGRSQVWVMAVDGSNQRRLTTNGHYVTPAWSPREVLP